MGILMLTENFNQVYEAFKNASEGLNFTVYKKEELPEDWHFGKSRRIGPIVLITDLGYVFDDFYRAIISYNEEFNLTGKISHIYEAFCN
jgi:hypothetical protein